MGVFVHCIINSFDIQDKNHLFYVHSCVYISHRKVLIYTFSSYCLILTESEFAWYMVHPVLLLLMSCDYLNFLFVNIMNMVGLFLNRFHRFEHRSTKVVSISHECISKFALANNSPIPFCHITLYQWYCFSKYLVHYRFFSLTN